MQSVSLVILDLDNTLYDWVDFWHKSFKAMLDRLVQDSGIPEETLLEDFKQIHQKHGTAEYAFAIEELPSLQTKYAKEDLTAKFDGAIQSYRSARKQALRLYDDVEETLQILKDKGCLLVAYTESMAFYTNSRVKKLGLDRILDYVYSPPDHELPNGKNANAIRYYADDYYLLRRTVPRNIAKGELKPNPKILLDILKEVGGTPHETIYVGDSLMKDVAMAKSAGVTDVWAKYGAAQNRPEYELLKKVTHWTAKDVERERKMKVEHLNPSHVLETNFKELLSKFDFLVFQDRSTEKVALVVDVWKKTVDVQQHFNDLELRIRNYAVTVLAAMLSLAALGLKENLEIIVCGHTISVAAATLSAATLPWLAFYLMDRFWYHKLLYGAVSHGQVIEDRWKNFLPEISLTDSIGKFSPSKIFKWKIRSPRKIDLFYLTGILLLVSLTIIVQYAVHPALP